MLKKADLDHRPLGKEAGAQRVSIWRMCLGLHPDEATFSRRGFLPTVRTGQLELVGKTFIDGYNSALSVAATQELLELSTRHGSRAGFFLEGAAMGSAVRDAFGGSRLAGLLDLVQEEQPFLSAVGAGWAMARLPWRRRAILASLPSLLVPLAFDGWGFHDVYFSPRRLASGARGAVSALWGGAVSPAWDQGAGRAMWFVHGGDAVALASAADRIPLGRRADIAAGLGLAATYTGTGCANENTLAALQRSFADERQWLAQGAAFGLEARARAHMLTPESVQSALILTGRDPDALRALVQAALPGRLSDRRDGPESGCARYVTWRRDLAAALAEEMSA